MESSQVIEGTEECSSTETGWTKYIASPIHGDDYGDSDDDDNRITDKGNGDDDSNDDDDDDSMASDASSGPSHRELPCRSSEGSQGTADFKHAKVEDHSKCSSGKKPHKQVVKKRAERRMKVVSQESLFKANSATSNVQSGSKVTKNNQMDKGE